MNQIRTFFFFNLHLHESLKTKLNLFFFLKILFRILPAKFLCFLLVLTSELSNSSLRFDITFLFFELGQDRKIWPDLSTTFLNTNKMQKKKKNNSEKETVMRAYISCSLWGFFQWEDLECTIDDYHYHSNEVQYSSLSKIVEMMGGLMSWILEGIAY